MSLRDTTSTYGTLTRALHWALFVLIAAQFLLALSFDWFPKHSAAKGNAIMLHESIGLLVFVLGVVFILWRWRNPKPSLQSEPVWQQRLAKVVHIVIYAAVVAQPVFGVIMSMTHGHAVPFFGLFEIPQFIAKNKSAGGLFGTLHGLTGWWVLLIALGIHVVASLYHHFVRKDRIMRRMLSGDTNR